ncbi:MAG: PAS domain-containing protein [Deltaproteobacteria bacterium]|nr:PAS domain-containing protein [Deltaproteobacteria bacterium]
MAQKEIEVILARHLAEHLAMPIFIIDPDGDMLYYNEPAEAILGYRYSETGPMPAAEWSTVFLPVDEDGQPLKPEDLPLMIAMMKQHPAHSSFWIQGLDQARRKIAVTAFPLTAQANRFMGAVAIFWEVEA